MSATIVHSNLQRRASVLRISGDALYRDAHVSAGATPLCQDGLKSLFCTQTLWYFLVCVCVGGTGICQGKIEKMYQKKKKKCGEVRETSWTGSFLDEGAFKQISLCSPGLWRWATMDHLVHAVLMFFKFLFIILYFALWVRNNRGGHHEWKEDTVLYLPVAVKIEQRTPPEGPRSNLKSL